MLPLMPCWLQVQDEAAGLVVALLAPRPGEAILDACAAPGGKALFIAARMRNQVRPLLQAFGGEALAGEGHRVECRPAVLFTMPDWGRAFGRSCGL